MWEKGESLWSSKCPFLLKKMYQRPANQKTAAGALNDNFGLAPNPKAYGEDGEGKEITSALVNWSVTQGRVFIVRVTLAFLYATGVMAFLGFLSTLGADSEASDSAADRKRRYLCALSVVVNMVAVAHYKMITKIRGYEFGVGATASTFEKAGVSAFTPHNKKIAIGVEMAVDGIRHSDWLVRIPESACLTMHAHGRTACPNCSNCSNTLPPAPPFAQITLIFLIYKIYYIAGFEADGITPKTGSIFETPGAAAGSAVLMVVLSAIVRIGTDEVWDFKKNMLQSIGSAALWVVSLLIMILIITDIDTAVEANKGAINVDLYKSFYLIWIGYPIVSLVGWGVRLTYACRDAADGYAGDTPEWLSLVKDLAYCFLDSWSKGVFALWTAYSAFHITLLSAPLASPLP